MSEGRASSRSGANAANSEGRRYEPAAFCRCLNLLLEA
jgi:hypothetical protein